MKIWKSIACLMVVLCSSNAAVSDESAPFASLQWTFGSKTMKPDVVIGYRSVDVETNGDVSGWQGSVSYKAGEGFDKVKIEGVTGDENMQGTYGAGYSLQRQQALLTGGVTGRHLTAGADYLISHHRVEPYLGVTTLHGYDVPNAPAVNTGAIAENYAPAPDLQQTHFPEYTDCNC